MSNSIRVYNINLIQLYHYFSICDNTPCCVIFYAKWDLAALKSTLHAFQQNLKKLNGLHEDIILLTVGCKGSCLTEDYLVDKLELSQLPYIAIYQHNGQLQQSGYDWLAIDLRFLPFCTYPIFTNHIDYIGCILGGSSHVVNALSHLPHGLTDDELNDNRMKLYIAGDRSAVGKSSVCSGILSSLLIHLLGHQSSKQMNIDNAADTVADTIANAANQSLSYMKPVTQCEADTAVRTYCMQQGIPYVNTSPIIFYQGFTRAYLQKETETSEEMLTKIDDCIAKTFLSSSSLCCMSLLLVDGVGYPSVGSIVNLCNGRVAAHLQAPVLLVSKAGVGDAIDSFNLNRVYMQEKGCQVLGTIFNKLETTGFYALASCQASIDLYFSQYSSKDVRVYGYVPKLDAADMCLDSSSSSSDSSSNASSMDKWREVFARQVNLQRLIYDVFHYHITKHEIATFQIGIPSTVPLPTIVQSIAFNGQHTMRVKSSSSSSGNNNNIKMIVDKPSTISTVKLQPHIDQLIHSNNAGGGDGGSNGRKRSREEIERVSIDQGARKQ